MNSPNAEFTRNLIEIFTRSFPVLVVAAVVFALSGCGSSDDSAPVAPRASTEASTKEPMVVAVTEASGGPYETRTQLNYGANICRTDADQTCVVVGLKIVKDTYVVTIRFSPLVANPSKFDGEKQFSVVYDGDPVLDLTLSNQPASCVSKIRGELKGNGYLKLVSDGCGQGETVVASWAI